jgi:hypothetical protein
VHRALRPSYQRYFEPSCVRENWTETDGEPGGNVDQGFTEFRLPLELEKGHLIGGFRTGDDSILPK